MTLCHRGSQISDSIKYWLKPEIDWLIETGAIQHYPAHVPVQIQAESVQLAPINAHHAPVNDPDKQIHIAANFVLLLIGYVMDSHLLGAAGVNLYGPGDTPRLDPTTMATNVPGLYVAGTAAAELD